MSNDVSIAVVKADDAFYVEVISGRSNLDAKIAKYLLQAIKQNQDSLNEQEAIEEAKARLQEFVCEFGCYPDYGIEKLNWTNYLN